MQLLVAVIIGAISGWLAGLIMKAGSGGLLVNIILGILGSFVGSWLFTQLNISTSGGWLGNIITATVGAIVLIVLARVLLRRK